MQRGKDAAMKKIRRRRSGEHAFAWILMVVSVAVLILSYRIAAFSSVSSPGAFPMVAATVMVVSMALVLIENLKMKKPDVRGFSDEMRRALNRMLPWIIIIYIGIIIGYALLIQPAHFFPSSFIFLFVSMVYLRGTSWLRALLIASGTLIYIFIIFQYIFRVTLP